MAQPGPKLVAIAAISLLLTTASPRAEVPWIENLAEAIQLAKKQRKLIIAHLYTDWCVWCSVMERSTFADASVLKELGPHYVWLRLNTEKQADGIAAQKRFRISSYPTTLLLDPEEQISERMKGYLPPEEFLRSIRFLSQELGSFVDLREQVRSQPGNAKLTFELANKYAQRRDFRRAAENYENLISFASPDELAECYFYLALSLASDGKKRKALARLTELRKRFPRSERVADALSLQGQILFDLGEKREATRLWQDYLSRFPAHHMAPNIRGQLSETQ